MNFYSFVWRASLWVTGGALAGAVAGAAVAILTKQEGEK